MAKISELKDEELKPALKKYQQRADADKSDIRSLKIAKRIQKEIKDRGLDGKSTGMTLTSFNKSISRTLSLKDKREIKKYHTDEVDYGRYPDAPIISRFLALLVDGFILGILNQITIIALGILFGGVTGGLFFIIIFVMFVPFIYYYYTMKNSGQTVGKKLLKIRVVHQETGSSRFTMKDIIIRESIGKLISTLVFGVGYLIVFTGAKSFHDQIAKTKVVQAEE